MLKVRDQSVVLSNHVYMALSINVEGKKEVLGLWIEPDGATFWLKVIIELRNCGVADIFVVCCDVLEGCPQAIEAVFPQTIGQTCSCPGLTARP